MHTSSYNVYIINNAKLLGQVYVFGTTVETLKRSENNKTVRTAVLFAIFAILCFYPCVS